MGGLNAIAIAAGRSNTLALSSDGTVWAWGYNGYGQLGNGGIQNQSIPAQVNNLTDVVAIAAGEYHSLAIKSDGTIWAWGNNAQGQLGHGNLINSPTPLQVTGLAAVTSLSAGNQSLSVTPVPGAHLYWAFGTNANGQIGDSTLLNRNIRVLVHFPYDEDGNGVQDWKDYALDSTTLDSDRDGLTDWQEVLLFGTDPKNFDTNGDGLADGVNVFIGWMPLLLDTDGDGIPNLIELKNGTSPVLADTDGDGVSDKLDAFPLDRFRSKLPPLNPNDHTPPVIILQEPVQ